MTPAKLTAVKTQIPEVRVPVQVDTASFDQRIRPVLVTSSKARRLDVDKVLARSLPKVVGE